MNPNAMELSHEDVGRVAHSIWEQEGRPEGKSLDHWLMAEKQLRGEKQRQNSAATNEQSSVVAPAGQNTERGSRSSKGDGGGKRQSVSLRGPTNRIENTTKDFR